MPRQRTLGRSGGFCCCCVLAAIDSSTFDGFILTWTEGDVGVVTLLDAGASDVAAAAAAAAAADVKA